MSTAAIVPTAPRRHVLPPNATALEKAVDQVVPNWDGLAGAFPAPAQGEPAAFLPWLAAEWGIAQFDRYFDDVPALIANGLPWLRERGTAASMQRALGWLGYDGAQLDEDGAWLHLDLGRIIGDAELASVAHVVRASLPAHVRFYRVFHGHD
ncbi:phage tail protein, partial [Bacillus cereus group sp. BY112LC]